MNQAPPRELAGPRPHRRLDVWRDAMDLVVAVYAFSASWLTSERFGLTAQLRKAAVSVPSTIAEGAARGSTLDPLRFLGMARGSLAELDTQIEPARRLQPADPAPDPLLQLNGTDTRMNSQIRALESRLAEDSVDHRLAGFESPIPTP